MSKHSDDLWGMYLTKSIGINIHLQQTNKHRDKNVKRFSVHSVVKVRARLVKNSFIQYAWWLYFG